MMLLVTGVNLDGAYGGSGKTKETAMDEMLLVNVKRSWQFTRYFFYLA